MTRIGKISLAAVVLAAAAEPVAAAVFTWSGLGFQWSAGGSWQGGVAPPSNVNTLVVLTGTGNTSNGFMDLNLTLNSLTFTSEAGPFAFEGLQGFSHFLNFASGAAGAPRLDQFSASNHTIILPDGIGVGPNLTLGGTGTGSLTIDGPLLGPGRLILNGPYTVITTAATGFSTHGGTTLNAGTLRIEQELSLGGSAPIFGGGTLQLASSMNINKSITLNAGGGTIDANGFAFSITNGAQNVTGAGRLTLTSTAPAPGTSTIAARLQQTGGLLVSGVGHVATLTNTVANTYTGGTTVNGGATLSIDSDRLGNASSGITLDSGTLRLNPVGAFTINRTIALGAGGGTFNTTTPGPVSLNGVISGSGGLKKISVGTLRLLAANTYSGPTTLSAGFLEIGHEQAAQNSTVELNGGTLSFATPTATATLGGLAGSAGLSLSGLASLNIGNNNASTTYAGNLTGSLSGALGKMGSGTWTLTGANTCSGQFAVQGGTVVAGSAGAISPNASITVSPGATLDLNGFDYTMSHANGIEAFSGSTLRLNGANLTVAAGSTGDFYGSVPMQFGTITAAAGAVIAYSGAALSNGFIAGPGTQFVTGANTFNNIIVFNGVALAQSAGSVLNLNNSTLGGALTVGGTVNWTNGSVTSSGQVVVNSLLNTSGFSNNGTITVNNGGTFSNTVSNLVSGGGSIVNVNAGGDVQLNGLSFDLHGALLSNAGTIAGGTLNIYYGSLAAGTGSLGPVVIHPGGAFTPGSTLANMPAPTPSGAGKIQPLDPNQSSASAVTLNAHTTATVSSSDVALTLTGPITAPGKTLTKAGGGTLAVASFRGGAIAVDAGTMRVIPNGSATGTSFLATVAIAGGAKFDLTDNKLIVTGQTDGAIENLIVAGRNGGSWNGSGMVTSMSDASPASRLTTLAVATAGEVGKSSLGGLSVNLSDVLVMYTYAGDADLTGSIDGDDFGRIDAGYSAQLAGYSNGDFDYSGNIDADDYWLIDRNYSRQTAEFSDGAVSGVTTVPEPAFGVVWGVAGVAGIVGRRRRGRRR